MDAEPVAILLGAGASHEAGIPLMQTIVDEFVAQLDKEAQAKMTALVERLKPAAADRRPDLELVLAALDRLANRETDLMAILLGVAGLTPDAALTDLQPLGTELRRYLRRRVCEGITVDRTAYLKPLLMFVRQFRTLPLFTLNYDVTIEMLADSERIRWEDGFASEWEPSRLTPSAEPPTQPMLRLIKLHGSVTWYARSEYRFLRIPVIADEGVRYFDHEQLSEAMVYPATDKVVQSGIYAELGSLLRTSLIEAGVVVIIGYSFRDRHVMEVLDEVLVRNRRLFIVIVSPEAKRLRAERVLAMRDVRDRCLPIEATTGDALQADKLLNTTNTILSAQQQLDAAEAAKPSNFAAAKRNYRQAIYLYRRVGHVDGVRGIVALDETSNPIQSGRQRDLHLLDDLPACLWFALTSALVRNSWWSMVASLLHWMERDLQNVRPILSDHAAPEGTSEDAVSVSPEGARLSVELLADAASQMTGDHMLKRYLVELASRIKLVSELRFGDATAVTSEAVAEYNAKPACVVARAIGSSGAFPSFDLDSWLSRVIVPTLA